MFGLLNINFWFTTRKEISKGKKMREEKRK